MTITFTRGLLGISILVKSKRLKLKNNQWTPKYNDDFIFYSIIFTASNCYIMARWDISENEISTHDGEAAWFEEPEDI